MKNKIKRICKYYNFFIFFYHLKRDKTNIEIENMKKNVFKIQGRENQFQTELRKKDSDLKKMQDQIKKIKENSFTYKNSMEITNALIQTGPNLFANNV